MDEAIFDNFIRVRNIRTDYADYVYVSALSKIFYSSIANSGLVFKIFTK